MLRNKCEALILAILNKEEVLSYWGKVLRKDNRWHDEDRTHQLSRTGNVQFLSTHCAESLHW
jgi:hypothetical protein